MRILSWLENYWPAIGGAETFASDLLAALSARGHEMLVVTRKDSSDQRECEHHRGIPVYRFPFWQALASREFHHIKELKKRIQELKKEFSPELIHLHGVGPSTFFHFESDAAYPAPSLVTLFSELTRPATDTPLTAKALGAAHWVTAVSMHVFEQARVKHPTLMHRSSVIYNAIPVPGTLPKPLTVHPPRLLCVGRLHPDKGFDLAISAFADVCRHVPSARLRIFGEGPERPVLERLVRALSLEENVILSGWAAPNQVPSLINDCSMVLMPSRTEAFGLVALQAAWMSRPVVASAGLGLAEIVKDKKTGLLFSPGNSQELANAILTLLKNPGYTEKLGKAALKRAQSHFDWSRCVQTYENLYEQLIMMDRIGWATAKNQEKPSATSQIRTGD